MYLKKPGHIKHVVKSLYEVYLPPVPDRELVQGYELKKKDQFWRRQPLPQFYIEQRQEESYIQEQEEKLVMAGELKRIEHYNPTLEAYRREEWRRRLYGHWFMNKGVPTYLTGDHYMYLQWSKLDHPENDGYPIFYMPQLDRFYFRQLCVEDPFSLGYIIIGARGFGKTSEEAACVLSNITRPPHKRFAAIQSKTEDDALEVVFQEKMVNIFNEYPDFFKPVYSHGTNPKRQMLFKRRSLVGKDQVSKIKFGDHFELGNSVRCYSAGVKAVDGKTLSDIISDEIGKTEEADVYLRHAVHLRCVFRNQRKRGIIRSTSTVEEMEKGGDKCYEIWKESDPTKRGPDGYTQSKIYKYMVTALETQADLADEYGYIDEKVAMEKVMKSRALAMDDPYKLAITIRKEPLSEEEAFIKDQSKCMFNVLMLNTIITDIRNYKITHGRLPGRQGRLEWVNDVVDGDVEFIDDANGKFTIWYMPDQYLNKTRKILNACRSYYDSDRRIKIWTPVNNDLWRGGCDPIKYVKSIDPRASMLGAYGMMNFLTNLDHGKDISDWTSYAPLWKYHGRSEDPEDDYENIIKAMRFFGSSMMTEGNVDAFAKHLYGRGYHKFMIVRRNFDPSVLSQKGGSKNAMGADQPVHAGVEVIDSYIGVIRKYLKRHGKRLKDLDLALQLLDFDPKKRTKYDLVVAFGHALLSLLADLDDEFEEFQEELYQEYFLQYDISGAKSVPVNNVIASTRVSEDEEPAEKRPKRSNRPFNDPSYIESILKG
jgi:hypothetical protein